MKSYRIYRMKMIVQALWALYRLSPEKVKAFLDAYQIFESDWQVKDYDDNIKKSLVAYYSVINYLCTVAQVEKMYIPPALDLSKSFFENQILFEERMATDLSVRKGERILDVGCGRGRIAAHVASFTGAHVTGMNIDNVQLNQARRFAKSANLSSSCEFVEGDLNSIPFDFADASFDAVYNVQAFSYSEDLPRLFRELYRVLKPGGKIAILEYVLKEAFDSSNAHHVDLLRRTKQVLGAIGSPTIPQYENAFREAGFTVTLSEDPSLDGRQTPLILKSVGKWIDRPIRMGILPKHFQILFERLARHGDAYVEADTLRLLTTGWYITATKP